MTLRSSTDLTPGRLRELLRYDLETGIFYWTKPRRGVSRKRPAGAVKDGYITIQVDGTRYYAHRLAWLYVHGAWPVDEIDHRNCKKDDNSIENLRPATRVQNLVNKGKRRDCGSPLKGTRFKHGRWEARISIQKRVIHLGRFDTPEQAHSAYLSAARAQHGSFAHG